jgi:hypothetical protein
MVDGRWHKPGVTRYIPKNAFETQLKNYYHSHIIKATWGKFDNEGNMAKCPLLNGLTSVMRDRTCSMRGRMISVCLGLQTPSEPVPAIQVGSCIPVKSLIEFLYGKFQFNVVVPMRVYFLFNFTQTIEKDVYFS